MRACLISLGLFLLMAGLSWPLLTRLGIGNLPGDIRLQRPGFSFYFPLTTSILVSVLLSLILMVITWFWRR
jgi:hypothetical protein